MTRVIHTGDTHLGYQQYHEPQRREDFRAAFEQVADDAVADDVDAVVHAGDLFHDRRPALPDILGAISVLRRLEAAEIPFLAIVGNHEAKRDAQWLDLFERLGLATRLGAEPVELGNTAFYGLDFVPRSKRDDLEPSFEPTETDYAALVTHGLFQPFPHGDWDARALLSAANRSFDALLLGDDHAPATKQIEEPSDTWLTYCGSTERASASEREDRGYNLVTFDAEDGVDIRRRGLDTRPFVFVDVELGPGEGTSRVRERVGQYDCTAAAVIVSIEGEGEPVTPATIEEFATEEGALVARVTDHREVADEDDVEVSFADPDAAIQERLRDLGLSRAALELDETIRASKIPDSNVADAVEDTVRALVEDGEDDSFEPAETTGDAVDAVDAVERGSDSDTRSRSVDGDPTGGDSARGTADQTDPDTGHSVTSAQDATDPDPADTETASDDADDQARMGEYL